MINWKRGEPVYDSDRAVWKQIADELRGRIEGGMYRPRQAIPSLTALMQEFGVARNTIRKVIAHLAEEGHVRTEIGVGTFVAPPRDDSER